MMKKYINKEIKIMNLFMLIIFAVEVVIGVASTLYLIVSLFAVIGYKIYRKCKYNISLYN